MVVPPTDAIRKARSHPLSQVVLGGQPVRRRLAARGASVDGCRDTIHNDGAWQSSSAQLEGKQTDVTHVHDAHAHDSHSIQVVVTLMLGMSYGHGERACPLRIVSALGDSSRRVQLATQSA